VATETRTHAKVPLLDLRVQHDPIRAEIDAAIARVLDHGQFILGPEVKQLEEKIAAYCGCRYAVACASGSDALLVAFMAVGIGQDDVVITTPYSFFATAGSISRVGALPVFVDIERDGYNLDPAALQACCLQEMPEERRARVKAILPVHLYGQCAEMHPILEIAGRYGIPVVEDAAQAIGAEYHERRAGSIGLCGCFSFFPSKNLGCLGDGGMITTNDEAVAARLRILRVHGSSPKYFHKLIGVNSRLDTLKAAVLLAKLPYLDSWTEGRQANAAWYRTRLRETAATSDLELPVELPRRRHVYNQFVVRTPRRDELKKRLAEAGIGCEIYYPVPLHLQECFAYCGYRPGDLPESEAAARETLAIPIQAELDEEARSRVVAAIQEFAAGR
jgi:dTDP-4-amino-4,6-dideoxygalactose transaminase